MTTAETSVLFDEVQDQYAAYLQLREIANAALASLPAPVYYAPAPAPLTLAPQ